MDRNLALEVVRVTEAAALAASRLMGRGDEKAADQAAVDAMRTALNSLNIDGTVVIGEGERDEAPMLYIGEKVGAGGPKIDIALDPLEGTTITAKGGQNALAVIAMAESGGFLNAPDTYMDKIAVGPGLPDHLVDLDAGPEENLKQLAKAKKMEISDLVACILDRPRHSELIARTRAAGVGDQGERQVELVGELLVRSLGVRADTDHLRAGIGEGLIVVAERARLLGASRRVVLGIEVQNHGSLSTEIGEPHALARPVGQIELRRRVADFHTRLARSQQILEQSHASS